MATTVKPGAKKKNNPRRNKTQNQKAWTAKRFVGRQEERRLHAPSPQRCEACVLNGVSPHDFATLGAYQKHVRLVHAPKPPAETAA